ncbi:WXG100 family type VII secretion target [Kitasatospora indigofera]|nr:MULTISPECIES: WXG100 family type VII secretion target [Kitasatospora]MCX5212858.1 WXG100 family type VII secretion target [Kitasatospora sp. NBC_00240]
MAGQFRTTAEEMDAFAKHMGEVSDQVQGELKKLDGIVSQIASGWQGQAATAYQNLQNRFNEDAKGLNEALRAIQNAIELTTKAYAATEAAQQSALGQVAGQI